MRKADVYFIAIDGGAGKLSVLYTAELLDVMRTITDMVMDESGNTMKDGSFIDFNQGGFA